MVINLREFFYVLERNDMKVEIRSCSTEISLQETDRLNTPLLVYTLDELTVLLTEITELAYEGLKKHDPDSRRRNDEETPLTLSQQQLLLCYGDIRPGRGP